MSTRLIGGGRFFTDAEIRLLLPFAKTVRSTHVRNGGGSSPLLSLCDEIFNDANGITQIPVYAKDGTLVGMVSSADINPLDESAARRGADRLVDGRPNRRIDALSVDPGEAYLSTPEVASRLGLPVRRVTEMLKQDRVLHGHQQVARGNWLVTRAEVERWVAEQQEVAP
jgi:hypothetical protein